MYTFRELSILVLLITFLIVGVIVIFLVGYYQKQKAPKIKCPFCNKWFPKLIEEHTPYIKCPHCHMKIMQG